MPKRHLLNNPTSHLLDTKSRQKNVDPDPQSGKIWIQQERMKEPYFDIE